MAPFFLVFWGVLSGCSLPPRSVGALEAQCVACHAEVAEEFAGSRHARASASETFRALRERAGDQAPTCDRCHAPEPGEDGSLGCVTCHGAAGNQGTRDGLLIHDLAGPVQGMTLGLDAPHDVVSDEFLVQPELCGTCHEVSGPGAFHESPYSHWAEGPAASEGTRCQDCHQGEVPGVPGGPTSHRFVGLGGDPEEALALLRRGAALSVESTEGGPVVVVTNTHGGHDLPDGASFSRELWLRIEVPDGPGWRPLAGGLDGEGRVVDPWWLSARWLREGRETLDPFEADEVQHNAVPAGGSRRFAVEAEGPLRACLMFRGGRADLAAELGVSGPGAPAEVVCLMKE